MSTVTTNLGMIKAEGSDIVNVVDHIANNFQILDNTFATNTPSTQAIGDTALMGASIVAARSDHKHAMPLFGTPVATSTAISAGVSVNIARADHVHTLNFGSVVALDGTTADGTAGSAARSDHKHATPTVVTNGIQFPATQVPSADANNLDDYEEGTWTPTLGGTATYSTQNATYRKIGGLVFIYCYFVVTTIGTGSTTTLSGLPFTTANVTGDFAGSIGYFNSLAVTTIFLTCRAITNSTTIKFGGSSAANASITNNLAIFGNSAQVQLTVVYHV